MQDQCHAQGLGYKETTKPSFMKDFEAFIPQDKGFRIPVQNVPINIQDPQLFALKPGDATTMMSTHTFIKEPNPDYLLKAMKYVYHSHDRQLILDKIRVTNVPNTWEVVAAQYLDIFTKIASRTANRLK